MAAPICSYSRAIEALKAGKVDLKPLIAQKFPLRRANDALQATASGLTSGFKAVIDCVADE